MAIVSETISGYKFTDDRLHPASRLLLPIMERYLTIEQAHSSSILNIFDMGCGNGAAAKRVHDMGYAISGVDPSVDGIRQAQYSFPNLDIQLGSAYDDLQGKFGRFDVVYSFEVVEHVYDPQFYATTLYSITKPGGIALVSTPYHGYLKNLLLAATGKLDDHFTALWPHGHIKFWSIKTLSILLEDAGFNIIGSHRVGRIPTIAKSMLLVARKPA